MPGARILISSCLLGERGAGQGVTAALLEQNGVRVFSESQIEEAEAFLDRTERGGRAVTRGRQ